MPAKEDGIYSTRPVFWQYTKLDALERFIPHGFSDLFVFIKELLDNACDACEKYGDEVEIELKTNSFSISNRGIIRYETLRKITDFSVLISEKYRKFGFLRGSVGHGLKIAILLGLTDENHIIIESGGSEYLISLKNRNALYPEDVLNIKRVRGKDNDNKTTIRFIRHEIESEFEEIQKYLHKYIAVNPNISFVLNGNRYEATSDKKKEKKIDIYSYEKEDFDDFIMLYSNVSVSDIVGMFNVPSSKIKDTIREYERLEDKDRRNLFEILKKYSKRLKAPVFGEDAIKKRVSDFGIEVLEYKKVDFANGAAEIALIDSKYNIVGVNGSCISDRGFYLPKDKNDYYAINSLKDFFPDKDKKWTSVCILYNHARPQFRGENKQSITHPDHRIFSAIKRLQEKRQPLSTKARGNWLIMQYTDKDLTSVYSESSKYKFTPRILVFLKKALEKTLQMYERYGPITLRQLYYHLVSDRTIENTDNSYKNFISHMTKARVKGLIDPDYYEDRSRYIIIPRSVSHKTDVTEYAENKIKNSLNPPEIDIWTDQPYYVEVWIEKDALVTLFENMAKERQVPLFPSRGYTSFTKIAEARKRFKGKTQGKRKGVILYFGDLDPSGMDIFNNIKNKFVDEDITMKRIALKPDQTEGLIPMPIKKKDKRSKEFREFMHKHGLKGCFELDAMNPDTLINLARNEINNYYDENLKPSDEIKKWLEKFENIKTDILGKLSS